RLPNASASCAPTDPVCIDCKMLLRRLLIRRASPPSLRRPSVPEWRNRQTHRFQNWSNRFFEVFKPPLRWRKLFRRERLAKTSCWHLPCHGGQESATLRDRVTAKVTETASLRSASRLPIEF